MVISAEDLGGERRGKLIARQIVFLYQSPSLLYRCAKLLFIFIEKIAPSILRFLFGIHVDLSLIMGKGSGCKVSKSPLMSVTLCVPVRNEMYV